MNTRSSLHAAFAIAALLTSAAVARADSFPVGAPDGVKVVVFQADASVCWFLETWAKPCTPHVTVLLFPQPAEPAVYRVTLITQAGGAARVQSKTVPVVDDSPSVTFTIGMNGATIMSVVVERIP